MPLFTTSCPGLRRAALPLLAAACLLGPGGPARGLDTPAENPLTAAEVCAKLQAHTSSDLLLSALPARRLLDAPTAADEQALRAAGASPRLVDALKSGGYTLSPFDANDARKRLASAAAGSAGGGAPGAAANPGHMANLLRGKLVTCDNGALKNYDDSKLAGKKYFALYFSASWCPPCRQFTPRLVAYYQQQLAAQHPEVEVVLVSSDETPLEMQNYMKNDRMPWAALRFERKKLETELTRYAGRGIPDLVLVDGEGKVLADSYRGKEYHGPAQVLAALAKQVGAPPPGNG